MVENHVSPTSSWQEEGEMVENHVSPTSVGRRRRRKMVENHVSPTSVWQEEVKNG